jgi:Uma2 family endonuclease
MRQDTLAPWAEPVPDAPAGLTANDLLDLPDDGYLYELVEGRLVRMPGSGAKASSIALYLGSRIVMFVRAGKLGLVTDGTGEYNLTRPGESQETALIPDVAFVREDRLPSRDSAAFDKALRLAPDLAVEIASPDQYRPEMAAKARLYLDRGVHLAWIVWPADRQVDIWRPGSDAPVATLSETDTLDGLDVLPSFTCPVAEIFS